MATYKEYRSVTEFPLHTNNLDREELETAYHDLRTTYRSLVISRSQLVRRQTEVKNKLTAINQNLGELTATFEKVQQEKQQLQQALSHSMTARKELERWGNDLSKQVLDLTAQITATTQLLGEFEAVYEEVKEENGIFSIWHRLQRLLKAAHRLLNTDIKALIPTRRTFPESKGWAEETPANINRSLLDE
jgi:uncharacterized phage infection (PIP) family protein YhgE